MSAFRRHATRSDDRAPLPSNAHGPRVTPELLEPRVLFAAGDLDPSFGLDGIAVADFGAGAAQGADVAVFGGRVYAAGSFVPEGAEEARRIALAAFDDAGRPYPGLGGDGAVVTPVPGAAQELLIQPDGKLVVLSDSRVVRFNADGTLDTPFGGGDGIAELDVGSAIALAPGGKIVVSGAGPGSRFAAARLNPDGSFDPTFDGDGRIVLDFGNSNDSGTRGAVDVAVSPDGKIVLVGAMRHFDEEGNSDGWAGAVARLNLDGSYDTTFYGDGRLSVGGGGYMDNGVTAVAVSPAGHAIVGIMEGEVEVRPSYLDGPQARFEPFAWQFSQINDIHVDPEGRVVVAGDVDAFGLDDGGTNHFLGRYTADGRVDRTFANDRFIRPPNDRVALAADGDILSATADGSRMQIYRYLGADADPLTSVHQAEHPPHRLNGAFVSRAHPGYTGAGYADFAADSGGSVTFETFTHHGGVYDFVFRYANGGRTSRTLDLEFPTRGTTRRITFPTTRSWSNWRDVRVRVDLRGQRQLATREPVTLRTTGQNGPNVDKLTVRRPIIVPQVPAQLEAEDALLVGARADADHPGYTGAGYADYTNAAGDSIQWTVADTANVERGLTFRYANGGLIDRPLTLSVNGGQFVRSVSFPPTGSWATWRTVTVRAPLIGGARGQHSITLSTSGSGGPNIDWLEVI